MSRQNLHKTYLRSGQLKISKDAQDKPYIDFSELLRVFPALRQDGARPVSKMTSNSGEGVTVLQLEKRHLEDQLHTLRDQLRAAEERERRAEGRIDSLLGQLDGLRLLMAPTEATTAPVAPKRGILAWLFGSSHN